MKTKKEILTLMENLKVDTLKVLQGPVVDPGAPAGFVRRQVLNAEIKRRLSAVDELTEQFLRELAGDDELAQQRLKKRGKKR